MNNKQPYQYAILRYIHDPVTDEFLNVGLVMYSKEQSFFRAQLLTRYRRLTNAFPGTDGDFYRRYMNHVQLKLNKIRADISASKKQSSLFDQWPNQISKILNQILPPNDSSIRFSVPSGGLSKNLDDTFDDMYFRLIEYYLSETEKHSRSNEEVWSAFSRPLREKSVLNLLRSTIISTPQDDIEFNHAWKNGQWNLLQPLSFDLVHPANIKKKAKTWLGNTLLMRNNDQWSNLYFLLGQPRSEQSTLLKAYDSAKDILLAEVDGLPVEIIEENEAEDFANEISPQIEEDVDFIDE